MARPTKYKPEYAVQARKLCAMRGFTDIELATFFDVSRSTLSQWKHDHPEFFESLKEGKAISDERVERALFERAVGYSHFEEKIFCNNGKIIRVETKKQYPPDPASCIFWLKNRQPDKWRDKVVNQHEVRADIGKMLSEARARVNRMREQC